MKKGVTNAIFSSLGQISRKYEKFRILWKYVNSGTLGEKVSLMGRPAIFDSSESLQAAIEDYLTETGAASTITGLAYYVGFESRQSFYDYENKDDFSYIIKRARLFIESCYETKLSANNPTGPIFFLKNMGWKDKTEVDNTIHMSSPPVINITTSPVQIPVSDNEE